MEVTVTFSDMPCFDPSLGSEGVLCGAFQRFVEAEVAGYSPRATDADGLQKEFEQFFEGLHDRFMDADLCLLARAMRARLNDGPAGLDVTGGLYGECPPLVGKEPKPQKRHLSLVPKD